VNFSREELLEQRALLQRHLAWIEGKLRLLESESSRDPSSEPAGVVAEQSETDSRATRFPPSEVRQPAPSGPLHSHEAFAGPDPVGVTRVTKAGCITLFVIASALVLATIFLLPLLIYG